MKDQINYDFFKLNKNISDTGVYNQEIDFDANNNFDIGLETVDLIMNKEVFPLYEEDNVKFAKDYMEWSDLEYLPVLNNQNIPSGVLLKEKISRHLQTEYYDMDEHTSDQILKTYTVREIMDKDFYYVTPQMTIKWAAKLMHRRALNILLVMNQDKIIGTLTKDDFLEYFMAF